MAKFPGTPMPVSALESRHWVAEIIYFPLETALLCAARAWAAPRSAGKAWPWVRPPMPSPSSQGKRRTVRAWRPASPLSRDRARQTPKFRYDS
jgi:hypothetical protein